MEKNWNRSPGMGLEKKRKKQPGETLTRLSGAGTSYAEGRDSVQSSSMPYAAGLQSGGYPRTPEKGQTEYETESPAKQETAPYLTGKDQVKEPELPYGAGPQAWGYTQPKGPGPDTTPVDPEAGTAVAPYLTGKDQAKEPELPYGAGPQAWGYPKPKDQEGNTTPAGPEAGRAVAPYLTGKDQVKEPELPYGAGPQAWGYPKPKEREKDTTPVGPEAGTAVAPYLTGKDRAKEPELPYGAGAQAGIGPQHSEKKEEPGYQPEKKAPKRTAQEVLDELEKLEKSYDGMLQEAEAWESQAALQETPEEISRWEEKGRELRQKAAELEPEMDALQKEWKYAMDWEWEEEKRKEGYRDPTLWDLTVGSFQQGYDTSKLGRESFRDMWGDEDNRKAELEEKLAGEEYKFMPEGWWEKALSDVSFRIGGEAFKAMSPEALATMGGAAGAVAVAGQLGPQAMLPEEVVTVPAAAIMGHKAGSIATNMEVQAGLAYNKMRENNVSEETARDIAMIIGGLDGALDIIPINSAIKYLKILDDSGASKEAIKFFLDKVEKMGVDTRTIIEAVFKTEAQEEISKAGVGIGTMLEGKRTPGPKKAKNNDADPGEENPWISDHTAKKLLEDQRMLDYLKRKGDLRLEKNMSLDQKILAVKEATAAVISGQKKYPSDSGVKKRSKDRAREAS